LFEIDSAGATHRWGTLNVWEPPNRLVIEWHPYGESGTATEIEIRFVDRGSSTLVELEHRNWEALGDQAAEKRSAYEGGWPGVLALFADSAGRPNTVPAGGAADGAS
ncbi:MAG: SRPBCC domain-containing protein, partial [Gemmatimonadota bacterium]